MEYIKAMILGLIQGLTEFLPVSSSGHLVLFQNLFGIQEATQAFSIVLHLATLIAVFVYYWDDIWELLQNPFQKTTVVLIVGTIPTVILALLFQDTVDALFERGKNIGFAFLFTGLVLFYADTGKGGQKQMKNMSIFDALVIGSMQGIAILPAVSRSGMTISACLARGMDRENAAKFSFLLSIPTILGAVVLTVKEMLTGEVVLSEAVGWGPTAVGFVVAALSGYFAIHFMVDKIQRGKLKWFSMYVFLLGTVLLADQFVLHRILR